MVRKFELLAIRASRAQGKWLSSLDPKATTQIQFDDLETAEHTKCKPVSVTLAVNKKTREILGFQVSRMPAKGHLAGIARRKYGYRMDERHVGWDTLFSELKSYVSEQAHFESDESPHYPRYLKKHFKKATHVQFKGARGAVSGQGELKKLRFDPLFSLNHTCAMLRANINRLFRRTWCLSKTLNGLRSHLTLYVHFHNQVLLQRVGTIKGAS